jgi:hypothetical protein
MPFHVQHWELFWTMTQFGLLHPSASAQKYAIRTSADVVQPLMNSELTA